MELRAIKANSLRTEMLPSTPVIETPGSYSSDRLLSFVNYACKRAFVRLTHCILVSAAVVDCYHGSPYASSFLFESRMIVGSRSLGLATCRTSPRRRERLASSSTTAVHHISCSSQREKETGVFHVQRVAERCVSASMPLAELDCPAWLNTIFCSRTASSPPRSMQVNWRPCKLSCITLQWTSDGIHVCVPREFFSCTIKATRSDEAATALAAQTSRHDPCWEVSTS